MKLLTRCLACAAMLFALTGIVWGNGTPAQPAPPAIQDNPSPPEFNVTLNLVSGTAFLAYACSYPVTGRECSNTIGVGKSVTVQRVSPNYAKTVCIGVIVFPGVTKSHSFWLIKNQDAQLSAWGTTFNPQFSYDHSVLEYVGPGNGC